MNFLRFIDHRELPPIALCAVQTLALPLSLSKQWLPSKLHAAIAPYHTLLVFLHLAIFVMVFNFVSRTRPWSIPDIARWALPEVIAGAVEIQRRGEQQSEASLKVLEKARYEAKGA